MIEGDISSQEQKPEGVWGRGQKQCAAGCGFTGLWGAVLALFYCFFLHRFLVSFWVPFGPLFGSVLGSFFLFFRIDFSGVFSFDFGGHFGSVLAPFWRPKSSLGPPGGEKADL